MAKSYKQRIEEAKKFFTSQGMDIEAAAKERVEMKNKIEQLRPKLEAQESQAIYIQSTEIE